jgi:N-acyl amino acid synthase of PEP-CTERM/exosortase system
MHEDAYSLAGQSMPRVPSALAGSSGAYGTDAQKSIAKQDLLTPFFQFQKAPAKALDSAIAQEMFRLRYEVYCLERGFLPADDFDKGLEIDEFDVHSTHFGGYNMENLIVGSVRLVQPPEAIQFPFEQHCPVFEDFIFPPREQSSEISRLVVRKTYRRRRGDSLQGISKQFMDKENAAVRPSLGGRRRNGDSPRLLLGLYREMYRHSRATGVRYWYAAMERSLAFSLRKMGFKFVPIGPATDYYGPVTPFMVDLDELNETLRKENRLLAAWFNDEPIPLLLRAHMWIMLQASKLRR